jgi:electron transport complex protein RnfB
MAEPTTVTRRDFIADGMRGACLLGLGGLAAMVTGRLQAETTVWQLDPSKCIHCGNCATFCVLKESAVKCVHEHAACGYCKICTGFLEPKPIAIDEGAENQVCPTGAIRRKFIEDPYYEYTIIESKCIGCAKCVKGCKCFGNGSLMLQVRHDRCLNCNECSIAAACPSAAFQRVPTSKPYLFHGKAHSA